VFTVLPEAFDKATGGGVLPTSVRSLFYQVRPLLEKLTHKVLDYTYFSQTLLTEYRDRGHELPGLLLRLARCAVRAARAARV
jgi:hypothetical protein